MAQLLAIFSVIGLAYTAFRATGAPDFEDWDELQLRYLVPAQVLLLVAIGTMSLLGWLRAGHTLGLLLRFLTQFVVLALAVAFLYLVGAGLGSWAGSRQVAMPELHLLDLQRDIWWLLVPLAITIGGGIAYVLWPSSEAVAFLSWRRFATLMTNLDVVLAPIAVWFVGLAFLRLVLDRPRIPTEEIAEPTGLVVGRFLGGLAIAAILLVALWPGMRAKLGSAWDALTFWPRFFHQLAPPPYAERAVTELSERIRFHVREGRDVVLLGHSQGSVIAYAALLRLETQATNRVSLVTYGSPLGTLYSRFFPAYFEPDQMGSLPNRLRGGRKRGWRNFYRATDYVGREVFPHPLSPEPAVDNEILLGAKLMQHTRYLEEETQVQHWVAARCAETF